LSVSAAIADYDAEDADGWISDLRSLNGLLTVAQRAVSAEFHRRMAAAGYGDIKPSATNLFEHVGPGGSTVAVMAQRAGVSPQAMVQIVDILEKRGYVERVPDPADRRAKLVCKTAKGKAMGSAAAAILADIEGDFEDSLGPSHVQALRTMLELVSARMTARQMAAE
jgi:DNA-binding MarR family transcriptional regulator